MNSFLFYLLTVSLLIVVQIQTGIFANQSVVALANSNTAAAAAATTTTTTSTSTTNIKRKKSKNGAPALSNMSGGTFLFFLANTLVHLFYFS